MNRYMMSTCVAVVVGCSVWTGLCGVRPSAMRVLPLGAVCPEGHLREGRAHGRGRLGLYAGGCAWTGG